ncbi:MAG: SPFH domain-containing protein [bacterium]|nr:SPFH domain-containing protein [bacterium]
MIARMMLVAGLLVAGLGMGGCTTVAPDPGFEAVLIDKPVLGGHGGVRPQTVSTGQEYTWLSTDVVMVDLRPQQFKVHFEDMMSSDGYPLDFDTAIRLRVINSPVLLDKFGMQDVAIASNVVVPAWYANNIAKPFETAVRQAIRKHTMNDTAIQSSAIEAIDAEVDRVMRDYIEKLKIPVELVDLTVGKANPPPEINQQRIATAAQMQRKLTEEKRKEAEDSRLNAETSRAKADNAYREAMKLSPDQFLALEAIKMQQEVCVKGGCTFLIGSGAPVPTLDLGKK